MPRRAARASQAEDGHAADGWRQLHAIDQPGIDGGTRYAGDGNEEQRRKVTRRNPGPLGGAGDGGAAEFFGRAHPGVVGLAPGVQAQVGLHGKGKVAPVHAGVEVQAIEKSRVGQPASPMVLESRQQFPLRIVMRREGAGDAGDGHLGIMHPRLRRSESAAGCRPARFRSSADRDSARAKNASCARRGRRR